jgi:integrase
MPRLVHMTWIPSQRRWTKMYRGTRYYVSSRDLGTGPTQAQSMVAANEWWEKKRAEIDGAKRQPVAGTPAAVKMLLEAWHGSPLETQEDAAVAVAEIKEYYADKPLPREVQAAVLGTEKLARIESGVETLLESPAMTDRTIGRMVDTWIQNERDRITAGKLTHSRADQNRICLCHFRDWIGSATPVEALTAVKWLEWYNFLADKLKSGTWTSSHVDRIFGVSKRFVIFLWELELIDRPRNLDKRSLSFEIPKTAIQTWSDDEIRRFYAVVKNQSRLHFLLMLNCGMLAKDVSDLRQDQVDWTAGTITRKRSKTHKKDSTPQVTYKLWPQTFELLQQWRSTDPETVLLTQSGKKWITDKPGESYVRSDSVASALRWYMAKAKLSQPPMKLRTTAATKLGTHPAFKFYTQYFLGQSPRSVTDSYYVQPNQSEFFEALAWLEGALGLR